MNAARRLPRDHGNSTVVCSAVAITDLINRLFMVGLFSLLLFAICSGFCLLLSSKLSDQSGGFWAKRIKSSETQNFICGNFERIAKIDANARHASVLWENRLTYARNLHQSGPMRLIVHGK